MFCATSLGHLLEVSQKKLLTSLLRLTFRNTTDLQLGANAYVISSDGGRSQVPEEGQITAHDNVDFSMTLDKWRTSTTVRRYNGPETGFNEGTSILVDIC